MMTAIQGQDIICFSNDWNGDPLSKKHIMTRLARHNRVLWVNSIGNRNPTASVRDFRRALKKVWQFAGGCRPVARNLWVCSPLAIPFHGSAAARRFNRAALAWSIRRTCRALGFERPLTWTFLPSSAGVAGALGERALIYHCVDEFSEFTGTEKSAIREMERRLLEKADVVFVSSGPLLESKRLHNPNTFLVTHGVDVEHFRRACDPETFVPPELAALPRPVIGFFGLIADWVDLELVRYLAAQRPQWSFVLIGKEDTATAPLRGLRNVWLVGQKKYAELPAWCKGFDAAILPFVINELTLAANPLKLREYLAAGLPVVSTAIPEAERLGALLRIGRNPRHFLEQLELSLEAGRGPRLAISQAMDSESWDKKLEQIGEILARRLPQLAGGRARAA